MYCSEWLNRVVLVGVVLMMAASARLVGQDHTLLQPTPFKIHVPDSELADLKARLSRARYPEEGLGGPWAQGMNLAYLKELVAYWRDRFDWRAQEARLNRFSQYMVGVDGLNLHFIHQRSRHPNALPLLISHGWPGSIVEFEKIVDPLTDPVKYGGLAEDAFHVVAPSIPGFGFSEKPRERGYNTRRVAALYQKLMEGLGYTRYAVQGGDFGAVIGTALAARDHDHVVGLHLNMCVGGPPADLSDPFEDVSSADRERYEARRQWFADGQGYMEIQETKPQTIGYALNDSPVGLAAWIVEKFHWWTDPTAPSPERKFTKDELLTNVTLYWVTQTAASSARMYYESRHPLAVAPAPGSGSPGSGSRIEVPTGCAVFPNEVVFSPRAWLERRFKLTRYTEMPRGGHFAALEEPGLLVDDVRAFFRGLRAPAR